MPRYPSIENPFSSDLATLLQVHLDERERALVKPNSTNDAVRESLLDTLAALGGLTVQDDALVFEGTKFVLPAAMLGDIKGAIAYLKDYQEQQESHFDFSRQFLYRPDDGAYAFQRAMKKVFGTVGVGKSTYDFFGGEHKPQYRTINTGPSETTQVPWGRVALSPLDTVFELTYVTDPAYGPVFALIATAPRKYRAHIEAFFRVVEDELRDHSLFRGKAFDGGRTPRFLDTTRTDPATVVYSEDVLLQLNVSLWSVLRHTDRMRAHNIPLKRGVLIAGPYGTGKTLAGELTAQEAVAAGWTFILARPGDPLDNVLQTAQLYSPACIWFEDLDVVAQGHSERQISALLDSLDGIRAKGADVLAAFTTNHIDKIQKGVLRPGRIDAVIPINGLDAAGYEKLIRVTIPNGLHGDIDYQKVVAAFDGFLPAFAKEAIDRATRHSIARNSGEPDVITTDDLVYAAQGLRPQVELMESAAEGVVVPTLDRAVATAVQSAVTGMRIVDSDGDSYKALVPADDVSGHMERIPTKSEDIAD